MEYNNHSYPRVLIISRNALRQGGSNGKVLGQLFANWPQGKLAQFYSYNEFPDNPICTHYYRVTDSDSLRSFLSFKKKYGGRVKNCYNEAKSGAGRGGVKKTPLSLLVRDLMWNSGRWQSKDFWDWISDFNPEVIIVMAGASSFTHKIAVDVAIKYHLPLVVFNTENYYFKNYNYLINQGWGLFYPFYKRQSERMFRRLMRKSSYEVYNNDLLEQLYYKGFGRHGSVLYQATSLQAMPHQSIKDDIIRFSYAGNLGLDRHKALIEMAAALQNISSDYFIDVYGRATSEDVENSLNHAQGIRFHGLVPYSQVLDVIEKSHFMVHAESFDPFWIKDLCTAFSTKISDILAAGRCLILYAHESLACTQYVLKNECGCVINSSKELEGKLRELISSQKLQQLYIHNGLIAASRDMNSEKNSEAFRKILVDVIGRFVK